MIDTAPKRRSAAGWPLFPFLPRADGLIDTPDREQVCGSYRGIAALAPVRIAGFYVAAFQEVPRPVAVLIDG